MYAFKLGSMISFSFFLLLKEYTQWNWLCILFPLFYNDCLSCYHINNFYSLGDGVTFPTRTVDNDNDNLLASRQRWMEEGGDEFSPGNVFFFLLKINLSFFLY